LQFLGVFLVIFFLGCDYGEIDVQSRPTGMQKAASQPTPNEPLSQEPTEVGDDIPTDAVSDNVPDDGILDEKNVGSVIFVRPGAETLAVSGDYNLSLLASELPEQVIYSVFYTLEFGATTGGSLIFSQDVSRSDYLWDTTLVDNNVYYFYVTYQLGEQVISRPSSAGVLVANLSSNVPPSVTLTNFANGGFVLKSVATAVSYAVSDLDGDSLSIRFDYSADSGETWVLVAAAHTGLTSYSWDTSALSQGPNYRVRLTVVDGQGGSTTVSSAADFGVAATNITWSNTMLPLFQSQCSGCHLEFGSGSSVFRRDLYSSPDKGAFEDRFNIVLRVGNGTMPPGGGVGVDDLNLIKLWIQNGAPE
tara:strand:- start:635 stop:1717 length:1083 start_codon:yes stop_codon:yes gene_type:complete